MFRLFAIISMIFMFSCSKPSRSYDTKDPQNANATGDELNKDKIVKNEADDDFDSGDKDKKIASSSNDAMKDKKVERVEKEDDSDESVPQIKDKEDVKEEEEEKETEDNPEMKENGEELQGDCLDGQKGEWIKQEDLQVNGLSHEWYAWLPEKIDDPNLSHSLVLQLHGCSRSISEKFYSNIPVEAVDEGTAIHIRPLMNEGENCWDHQKTESQAVELFDNLLQKVTSCWRVDMDRIFLVGWSSGAYLSHQLSCVRGDSIRAVAMNGGGRSGGHGQNCGNADASIIIDEDDITNVNPQPRRIVAREALDKYLADNSNCNRMNVAGPAQCIEYEEYSCDGDRSLVWCMTSGQGHKRQPEFSTGYFWDFLNSGQ